MNGIAKDIHNIYKEEFSKTKRNSKNRISKPKAVKKVHERIYSYYNQYKNANDFDLLLNRLLDVEYALKHKNSIIASYIVGIASGIATFFLTYKFDINTAELDWIGNIFTGTMIFILIFLLTAPVIFSSYSSVKTVYRSRYQLITLQYERDILIFVLREYHQFDCKFIPKKSEQMKV